MELLDFEMLLRPYIQLGFEIYNVSITSVSKHSPFMRDQTGVGMHWMTSCCLDKGP